MAINVRTKGQEGEREVAKMLNGIVATVRSELGLPAYATNDEIFQRNQNQSAVGGADLSNPLRLKIEIKRQEALSVNTWWKQCVDSAARTGGVPVLMYRQNRKAWRVCMYGDLPLQPTGAGNYGYLGSCKVEVNIETFKQWFRNYYLRQVSNV